MPSAAPSIAAASCRRTRSSSIGEPDAMGYDALQDELGRLIHGEAEWTTLRVPKPVAQARRRDARRSSSR